jgi:hypothetical protein
MQNGSPGVVRASIFLGFVEQGLAVVVPKAQRAAGTEPVVLHRAYELQTYLCRPTTGGL